MNNHKSGNLACMGMVLIFLSFLSFSPKGMAATVEIISPKGPLPSVVTTDQKADQDNAADFCSYFSRVSGRTITPVSAPSDEGVIIHVGRDAFVREHAPEIDKLFADGYIVKAVKADGRDHIILAGRIEPSTQWAIEQFLKDYCGVRWLFPDPVYGEIIPSKPTITVNWDLSKKYEPDFLSRGNLSMYYFNPARTTLRLRAHGYPYGSHGIQWIFNNGSYSGEIFAKHPEWFAYFMDDAKTKAGRGWENDKPQMRRQWWPYGNGWQICTTNPGTVEHTVKYVLDYFKKDPNAPMVSIGLNDGWGECECPECIKFLNSVDPPYSVSERWWHWVNQVAKEVKKTYPDKWLESLAYSQTSSPPRFPLESNVAITKTIVVDSELDQSEQWAKVCKSVNLYSYMFGFHMFGFRHYPHAAQDFLKWGHDKLGALAHAPECAGNWTFDGPKYHYIQALQWDVNSDVNAVMDEFCTLSYGTAAKPMRDFWDHHEKVYENRESTPHGRTGTRFMFYQWPGWSTSEYLMPNNEFNCYSLADTEFLDRCIKKATRLARKDSKEVQFRVERTADAWNLVRTMLLSKLKYYDQPEVPAVTSKKTMKQAMDSARELAGLRADRISYLGKLRTYPNINPYVCKPYYWSMGDAYTIFSHEQTALDDMCSAISNYMCQSKGNEAVRKYWQAMAPDDNLYQFAQTQLYLLNNPSRPNQMLNGGFETETLSGWDVSGKVDVLSGSCRSGKFAARMTIGTLSQSLPVSPMTRYRLTAWVRYTARPDGYMVDKVPAEITPQFFLGSKGLSGFEPLRSMLRTKEPEAGWTKISVTMTAPPDANKVVINLQNQPSFEGSVLWDDVVFEKIKPGPTVQNGYLEDDFSAPRLDVNQWVRCPVSPGFKSPEVRDGWLTFSNDSYTLVSLVSFNDLLAYTGENRYRLKFHVKSLSTTEKPPSFDWEINTGMVSISTSDSGMYWTHNFSSAENPKPSLVCHSFQNGKLSATQVYTGMHLEKKYDLKPSGNNADDVWYTLYFDPESVTIYASAGGYDESDETLVANYMHGIKNLTENGSVYLKLSSGLYMLDEISLTSPRKVKRSDSDMSAYKQIWNPPTK